MSNTETVRVAPTVTIPLLATAFAAWETDFRLEPAGYLSAEEAKLLGVDELSARRAEHMMALIFAVMGGA